MAAVRSLQVSVKPDTGSDRSESDSESEPDRDPREPEPMEVEEGELESISVQRSLKDLLPDTSRRYENKAGTFITGIDVTSKEAVEKKDQRAKRFHLRAEENLTPRNVVLDRETIKKAVPRVRLEAVHMTGVEEMSTQDVFGYYKEYPPAHIEWIDDASCNVVWLDDVTSTRALINISRMPDLETEASKMSPVKSQPETIGRDRRSQDSDEETEEGEVDDESVIESDGKARDSEEEEEEEESEKKPAPESETDLLSQAEKESLLRNDLRPATKPFKGNKLFMRFATHDDKKELGAARRSQYYMKYGNPNYGGMKGILSNSWKRRFHTRRIQRDVLKTKKSIIGDDVGLTPPYKHRHSDLVNVPEEPIEEEEEEEEEEEDMDEDERVVEYREERERERGARSTTAPLRRPSPPDSGSDSDEMDYDLELKMISTPSPKKSMKMTMYADEVESKLKTIRNSMRSDTVLSSNVKNRIGTGSKTSSETVTDVRLLLEEKRQNLTQQQHPSSSTTKTDVRQRLGKRPHSPDSRAGKVISPAPVPRREPLSDVHSRLGTPRQDPRGLYSENSKDKKPAGNLWSRLGSSSSSRSLRKEKPSPRKAVAGSSGSEKEEDDSELQRVWGNLIKEKKEKEKEQTLKKSRLDNLPSLQIEISRDSSNGSDSES
ncbi:nuclear cap-binding protein subunit 3-like [Acipenser oxyrinchus oxyrinchus]|uniref:Nuclear cap-binding protein subunit 3 n=1 Tax=Acipenser oxyrinchus oxyrinchus TaxID=40147 RepID=A0AAD8FYZ7_ACIOX|nr:nuclear cap-binding protein subunit 3-like [Acipenser oxyrinchus oxyrinchus]